MARFASCSALRLNLSAPQATLVWSPASNVQLTPSHWQGLLCAPTALLAPTAARALQRARLAHCLFAPVPVPTRTLWLQAAALSLPQTPEVAATPTLCPAPSPLPRLRAQSLPSLSAHFLLSLSLIFFMCLTDSRPSPLLYCRLVVFRCQACASPPPIPLR